VLFRPTCFSQMCSFEKKLVVGIVRGRCGANIQRELLQTCIFQSTCPIDRQGYLQRQWTDEEPLLEMLQLLRQAAAVLGRQTSCEGEERSQSAFIGCGVGANVIEYGAFDVGCRCVSLALERIEERREIVEKE
jgi:hypothetical protein